MFRFAQLRLSATISHLIRIQRNLKKITNKSTNTRIREFARFVVHDRVRNQKMSTVHSQPRPQCDPLPQRQLGVLAWMTVGLDASSLTMRALTPRIALGA